MIHSRAEMKLSYSFKDRLLEGVQSCWKSPSNIALVKYWGKKGFQLPANASLSFTLQEAFTITKVTASWREVGEEAPVKFFFEGKENTQFASKIEGFIKVIHPFLSFLPYATLVIESENNFPHSAGIASSASSMSALALCLVSIEQELIDKKLESTEFFQMASNIARLGSGSACRSVYGGFTVWGEHGSFSGSSNEYAVPLDFTPHEQFQNIKDTILLVDNSPKKVSSTAGHQLMNNHPFAQARLEQASANMSKLRSSLLSGDWDSFASVVESEALSLHALMMTSTPGYLLMQPGTINIINRLSELRKQKHVKVCFTLDAGPNIHLLYPGEEQENVIHIIEELKQFCPGGKAITDRLGSGPEIKFSN